jgi:dihydroorotase
VGVRFHAQHLSTAGSALIVREGKRQGVRVTAEAAPHHLLLTEESCQEYDTNYKMNPPLRSKDDVMALRQAVADGTIDCLASDHAPHLRSEKELEFLNAPSGIIALDCALGLYVKALIESQCIDWPRLIELMTIGPARILGLAKGTLGVGCDGDIAIVDPQESWRVDVNSFFSKSRNCPYNGWELRGRAVYTIVAGAIQYQLNS